MKDQFTQQEIEALNKVCNLCEHCDGKYTPHYCKVVHSDSAVFRWEKCKDKIGN